MTEQEKRELNKRMAEWFGLGVTRCSDADCDCGGDWNAWE